jgi:hypothetical protein
MRRHCPKVLKIARPPRDFYTSLEAFLFEEVIEWPQGM